MDTPKNIRQVGDVDSSHKIYIEDYVVTYTKNLGKQHTDKAAVLLGHKNVNNSDVETFINGMVVIDDFSLAQDAAFSNEKWSSIYDGIKEYYNDEEIVGWLFIGDNYDVITDKRLINIHNNNFNGKNALFLNYNYIEKEETFYDYINNAFVKRKGFNIYYQKNETMHNYMIGMNEKRFFEGEKEENVIRDFRNIMARHGETKETRKIAHSAYAAVGMIVASVTLLVCTTAIYRYNDRQRSTPVMLETSCPVISENVDVTGRAFGIADVAVESGHDDVETTDSKKPEEETGADEEVRTTYESYSFYVVKPGDSLGKISEKIYSSIHYVDKIKEMNNIKDVDKIAVGQKILLPDAK